MKARNYDETERSSGLNYHIPTSGRSLHTQALVFNDIRGTTQALSALCDSCNALCATVHDIKY
ncbi:MAG: hypothetical protein KTR25_14155 [Myxococcales bacterium]|nr:hypothetical protein [Myxococcales bacterium]